MYAGTERGVFKGINGASLWIEMNTGLTHRDVFSLAVSGDGATLYAATYGGGVFDFEVA